MILFQIFAILDGTISTAFVTTQVTRAVTGPQH